MTAFTKLNGVGFLLAVVLMLTYLIARPHIGTLYTANTFLTNVQTLQTRTGTLGYPYTNRADCERAIASYEHTASPPGIVATGICTPKIQLLWGW